MDVGNKVSVAKEINSRLVIQQDHISEIETTRCGRAKSEIEKLTSRILVVFVLGGVVIESNCLLFVRGLLAKDALSWRLLRGLLHVVVFIVIDVLEFGTVGSDVTFFAALPSAIPCPQSLLSFQTFEQRRLLEHLESLFEGSNFYIRL